MMEKRISADYFDESYFKPGAKSGYALPFIWENEEDNCNRLASFVAQNLKPASVLDVGCALGFTCRAFMERGINAEGCDISRWAIENCDKNVAGKLKMADIRDGIPYDSESFDCVFSSQTLEHVEIEFMPSIIKEMARITKSHVLINVPISLDDKNVPYGDPSHQTFMHPSWWISLGYDAGLLFSIELSSFVRPQEVLLVFSKPRKVIEQKNDRKLLSHNERCIAFDRKYFEGGGVWGGYAREGYWDYPAHFKTFEKIMERNPGSVLEIGCARGYTLKRLCDHGVTVGGLDISKHCYLTRATDEVQVWDITQIPWPIKDKQFDLIFSCAVLEHIPENEIENVIEEMARVSKRGLHGIDPGDNDDGFDKTHCTLKPLGWWASKLPHSHEVIHKNDLEQGPIIPPPDGTVKLNLGSFSVMFYYGWTNIDIYDLSSFASNYGYLFKQHDVRKGLPYDDNVVDIIFSSHLIEHLTYDDGRAFVAECYRVLKPGGVLRLSCPDARKLMQMYNEGALSEFDEINEGCHAAPSQIEKFWSLIAPNHLSAYDRDMICSELEAVGFKASRRRFRDSGNNKITKETIDTFPDISLFVEGVKL